MTADKRVLTLFDTMVDPASGEPLSLTEAPEPALLSPSGARYPVIDDIPRFVDPELLSADQLSTSNTFSIKWEHAARYGHDDASRRIQHDWYLQRYGWESEQVLASFLKSRSVILDAGCGVGRDVAWYLQHTLGTVVGIDISAAVNHARNNVPASNRLLLIQADIARTPFPPDHFDFICCDQVLHHTTVPRETFRHLVSRLSPGGFLSFYVYKVKGPVREFCDDRLREMMQSLSEADAYALSEAITTFGRALTEQKVTVQIPVNIPQLGITAGDFDLQRWLYWTMFKCYYNVDLDWTANVMTNYDWYRPVTAFRYEPDEIRAWISAEHLEIIHEDIGDAGLSYRCRKPHRQNRD